MFVKIDTRPDFRILRFIVPELHANMADELLKNILDNLETPPHHLILESDKITGIEPAMLEMLEHVQAVAAEKGYSFYLSGIGDSLAAELNNFSAFKRLNSVPTLTEAIDMVMMEKLERELWKEE